MVYSGVANKYNEYRVRATLEAVAGMSSKLR